MSSLEELLVKSGAMTEAQLDIVRAEQEQHGGSLDANILALGYLTEHALQRLLEQLFHRESGADFALEPTAEALALMSREQAEELCAVPQRLVGSQLHILVERPETLGRLGELPKLGDYDFVAVGVNQIRLRYLLDQCYGVPREPRDVEIMDRLLARTAKRAADRESDLDPLIGDPMAGLEPEWMAGAMVVERGTPVPDEDLDADVIPLLEEELLIEVIDEEDEEEDQAAADRALQEAHQSLAATEFRAALDSTQSMEELPDLFFRFGVPYFKSVALFKVQSNMVMGWRGAGLGIVSELIRGIVVPVQSDTFLAKAIEAGIHSGQAGANPVEERITEQLGAARDAHVVTGAVKVGTRPVLVVCGVAEGEAPAPQVVSDLGELCAQASETVLRLIMARKKSKQPEEAEEEAPASDKPAKKKASKKKGAKKKGS